MHKTFDVTLFGSYHVLQFAARKMAAQPVLVDPEDADPSDELTVNKDKPRNDLPRSLTRSLAHGCGWGGFVRQ